MESSKLKPALGKAQRGGSPKKHKRAKSESSEISSQARQEEKESLEEGSETKGAEGTTSVPVPFEGEWKCPICGKVSKRKYVALTSSRSFLLRGVPQVDVARTIAWSLMLKCR